MDLFNNLWVMSECLLDEARTYAFRKAIKEVVKEGDIVMDAGTGSGILSLFAAEAGAKKVYSVDIAEDTIMQANKNFNNSIYKNRIETIQSDLNIFNSLKNVDVLIMEMLDTGLVCEHQAPALNNLRANSVITDKTKLIPYRVICAAEPIEYDFDFYGFYMPFILEARNHSASRHVKNRLAKPIPYIDIDLGQYINTKVNETIRFNVNQTSNLNALRLKTKTFLSPSVAVWATTDMNMPAIVPLEPRKVKKGEPIAINIQYIMSKGFGTFQAQYVE